MGRPDGVTLAAFAAMVLLGGANAVGIRYTNEELAPMWGATLRFGAAGAIFLLVAVLRGVPFPRGRALVGAALYGLLAFGGAYALIYWGLVDVPAGLAQIVLGSVPLATVLLAGAQRVEPLRLQGAAGALLALVGIGVVFLGSARAGAPLLPLAAIVAAALFIAQAGIFVKSFPRSHPLAMNAIGMLVGAGILLALSLTLGEPHRAPTRPATWAALAYLVAFGSLGLFALFLFVISRWTASATSYQFVLFPFVTVALGALLRGETLTPLHGAGAVLVLLGVYLGALHARGPAGSVK